MTEAILLSAGTIGPLAVASTIFSKRHPYERWAKIALVIWGLDTVAWGVSGLVLSSIRGTHNRWYPYISHWHSVFAGAGLSLMLLLLLSGQLNNPRQLTPEQRLAVWWRGFVIGLILTAVVITILWGMTFWRY